MAWELCLTLVRLGAALFILVLMAHRGWLARGMFLSALLLALSAAMTPWHIVQVFCSAVTDEGMVSLACALAAIYVFSGDMEQSGQNRRMMDMVARAVPSRALQFILFPALVGFFPIPGGAIFTCPLVEETARPFTLNNEHKALLNYWFRHIGEVVTPLSPGILLFAAMGDCSFLLLLLIGVPTFLWATAVGWFFFLRNLPRVLPKGTAEAAEEESSGFFLEALPMLASLALAVVLRLVCPALNAGFSITVAFVLGAVICRLQNRLPLKELPHMLLTKRTLNNMLVILGIFFFKAVLEEGDMLRPLGALAEGEAGLFLICTLTPLIAGILIGLLMGGIGVSAPVVLGVIQHYGAWDERIAWIALTVMFSYLAEQLSPMHVCLVVTAQYFQVSMSRLLRRVLLPAAVVAGGCILWFCVLLLMV